MSTGAKNLADECDFPGTHPIAIGACQALSSNRRNRRVFKSVEGLQCPLCAKSRHQVCGVPPFGWRGTGTCGLSRTNRPDCRTARRTHRSVRAEPFVRETGNRGQRRSGGIEVRAQSNRRRAWLVPFTQKRHSIIVRAHEAGHPAVAKAPGIKERPQIRFAIVRLKPFGSRETSGTAHRASNAEFPPG